MPKLSVTLITKNEAADIGGRSRRWRGRTRRIVVDCGSRDDTVAIARRLADRVDDARRGPATATQKNYAASLARHDWILSLDADEAVTPELARRDPGAAGGAPAARGYRMPRVTWSSRPMDAHDRLVSRTISCASTTAGAAHWNEPPRARSRCASDGETVTLDGEIEHYAYRDVADHLETIDRYTTLAARRCTRRAGEPRLGTVLVHPPLAFLRNYVAARRHSRRRCPA